MISFTEFSSRGEVIHFAHANGYPTGCYETFLKTFFSSYKVIGMHARPLWEGKAASAFSNWHKFADDYITFAKENSLQGIIGIGHSMGAISSLVAASKKPDLFKKLILIDPVIPPPFYDKVSLIPFFITKRINPMVKIALRRKDKWSSREEAVTYFKSKKIYKRFDRDSFEDFINHGLKEEAGYYKLRYPKEHEAKVYSTLPSVWHILKNPPCPLIILRAEFSNVISDEVWQRIINETSNATFINVPKVGHMMPLEQPKKLAQLILPFV